MSMTAEQNLKKQLAEIPPQELIESVNKIFTDLAESGGRKFKMTVPPNKNDTDMLLCELMRRYDNSLKLSEKWIPVEKSLPDFQCLCIGFQDEMLIGYLIFKGGEYYCETDNEILENVTHWQHLPTPPTV